MRIDHGLKLEGDKLIITLPLEDGEKPREVVVNGKIYAPQEKAQLAEEEATSDLISRKEATTIPVMPKEHREYQTMNLDDAYEQGWLDYQKCIEELPSAGGCKCPCEYREPCDYCHYDGHLGLGCPAEEGLKDG